MTLVTVTSESKTEIDFFATRGFNAPGVSKVSAGVQVGRLAYRVAKYGYKRYFGYATRTRSRAAGTATGAGIGLGGSVNNAIRSTQSKRSSQIGQTRGYIQQSKSKRKYHTNHRNRQCCC